MKKLPYPQNKGILIVMILSLLSLSLTAFYALLLPSSVQRARMLPISPPFPTPAPICHKGLKDLKYDSPFCQPSNSNTKDGILSATYTCYDNSQGKLNSNTCKRTTDFHAAAFYACDLLSDPVCPSPTPTIHPPISLTPAPPFGEGCKKAGGVCCRGDYSVCQTRLINPWTDPTSGGCNPSKQYPGNWCCKTCSQPITLTLPISKVKLQTNDVYLEADEFKIFADNRQFFLKPEDSLISLHSDPSLNHPDYTTLEAIWKENNVEMRLFMYFYKNNKEWWVGEIRTYDGKSPGSWIYYKPEKGFEYFKTPLGGYYGNYQNAGILRSTSSERGVKGEIHYKNLKLGAFLNQILTPTLSPSITPPPSNLISPTPIISHGAYLLSLTNNNLTLVCQKDNKNCQFLTTVTATNGINKSLYKTTIYTSSPRNILEYIDFTGQWNSGKSQTEKVVNPKETAINTQVRVKNPGIVGEWYASWYIDGQTCNTNTTPWDCYFFGASSFTVTIKVI